MLMQILRALGRGLLALLRVLVWEPLVAITRGLSQGLGDVARRAAPWVLGAGAVWAMIAYAPELLNLLVMILFMAWGLKFLMRGLRPAPKKKKK